MNRFIETRLTNLDSALLFAELTHKMAMDSGDSLLVVRAQNAIGWTYQQKGYTQKAIEHFQQGLAIARRNHIEDRERHILNNLGIAYNNSGQYDNALKTHFESLALREKSNDQREIAISTNNIGLVYYQIKDYGKAIDFFNKSLRIKKAIGYQDGVRDGVEGTIVNLGLCYAGLRKYEEALEHFNQVLQICERNCEKRIKIAALSGAGIAYFEMAIFDQAEENLISSKKLAEDMNLNDFEVINLNYLSRIKLAQDSSQFALDYLEKSMELARHINYREWIRNNFKLFGEIYALSSDFAKAYEFQRKYDSLNREILNEEVIQNLARIQINYQEKENLQTISFQQTELTRRTTLLTLSIIIIVLTIGILFLLYRNNQHRKRVNRKLAEANDVIEKQNLELTNMNGILEKRVKERTEELYVSNAALLKSNTDLDNFIYKTSHDIRGPLATLQGVCNIALMDITEPKAVDYFNKLGQTAGRLNEILSKLLVINQINNSLISEDKIDFEELVSSIVDEHQTPESLEAINVEQEVETGLNFVGDGDLVRIILTNLISNALKFYNTSSRVQSFVRINVFKCEGNVCIKVVDNGIGIDENVSSKIFDIFSKGSDMSDTAGLGLYLVKLAVEKMKGQILLSHVEKSYTQFEVTLPYQ